MAQGAKQNPHSWAGRLQIAVNVVVLLGAVITAIGLFSKEIPNWFDKKIDVRVKKALDDSLESKIEQQLRGMSSDIIEGISISQLREDVDNLKNNVRPLAPQNLEVTKNSKGHLVLRWKKPNDNSITGYQILRRRPEKGEKKLSVYMAHTGTTDTTYTDKDAHSETAYAYRVKAHNAAGLLSPSSNFGRYPPLK